MTEFTQSKSLPNLYRLIDGNIHELPRSACIALPVPLEGIDFGGLAKEIFAKYPVALEQLLAIERKPKMVKSYYYEDHHQIVSFCANSLEDFQACLMQLSREIIHSYMGPRPCVAFPFGIGGKNWKSYEKAIWKFAEENPALDVCIVRLPKRSLPK